MKRSAATWNAPAFLQRPLASVTDFVASIANVFYVNKGKKRIRGYDGGTPNLSGNGQIPVILRFQVICAVEAEFPHHTIF